MMTALLILGGISALSTSMIVAGLFVAKRSSAPHFEANEIAFSAAYNHEAAATAGGLTPAFSH